MSLIDSYQRRIDYLRISITDHCNLNCLYCRPLGGRPFISHEMILRYEEILRIVRVAVGLGVKKTRVTGGEPLLRKGVVDFISRLSHSGIEDLGLTTNGILLKEFARPLREAGLSRVNISLDSLDPRNFQRITGSDGLGEVLAGIEGAREAGFEKIKINTVLIRGTNETEILDFAELAFSRGLEVRFIEYMPYLNGKEWQRDLYLTAEEVKKVINTRFLLQPVEKQEKSGVAEIYRIKDGRGTIGFISSISQHFCESCNRIRLTADGKLRNCLFSDEEIDIRGPMRDGVSDSELAEIIRGSVKKKPERRPDFYCSFKKCTRTMDLIGG
ncbi:MAG: GTP 3',8-cyclase MoaA [Proteobacteria bacterium]|nr:GTP 3',8-cyclase MoaA [Pseudomonadota bacterium]